MCMHLFQFLNSGRLPLIVLIPSMNHTKQISIFITSIIYYIRVPFYFATTFCCTINITHTPYIPWGTMVAQRLRCCATNQKVAGSIPAGVSGFFIDIKSFQLHYGPGVNSASNGNEFQEYFLWVNTAGV